MTCPTKASQFPSKDTVNIFPKKYEDIQLPTKIYEYRQLCFMRIDNFRKKLWEMTLWGKTTVELWISTGSRCSPPWRQTPRPRMISSFNYCLRQSQDQEFHCSMTWRHAVSLKNIPVAFRKCVRKGYGHFISTIFMHTRF